MNSNRKLKLNEPGFWPKWFAKLLFTLISLKVWGLIAGTTISTWLLMINLHHDPKIIGNNIIEYGINGAQWVTFNTTIWALIFGMKEIFRISEQRDFAEEVKNKETLENRLKVAGMLSCASDQDESEIDIPDTEKVGNNPDE